MAVSHLECKECKAQYALEALYVCERCFGPLQVAYDHSASERDVGELRRARCFMDQCIGEQQRPLAPE